MVFSSLLFLFAFLPGALLLVYAAPRRARNLVITLCSYVFYGWAHPAFCLLLLLSTAIDWYAGLVQGTGRWWPFGAPVEALPLGGARLPVQRLALVLSVVSNLTLLGFFKYFHFALDSWNGAARWLGIDGAVLVTALEVTLPLGISFYTFQSMSYSIDVWRGRARPLRSFVDFACFVSMFPQLVAGPIVRFSEVADQLTDRVLSAPRFARGVAFLAVGLAKKVLLANPCGKIADTVFEAASRTALEAWQGLFAYSFQIYFDFSGYSDMAIGLGLMLGFVFPPNFDSPYRATSITDFWRRWHLSLSTWLRDYLYLPLGGNRRGVWRTYRNLALVMLLGGLWHGAAWTFVAWGAAHGALLAIERAAGAERIWGWLPAAGRTLAIFVLVSLLWVPFRSADLAQAAAFFASLAGLTAADPLALMAPLAPVAPLLRGLTSNPYLLTTFFAAAVIVWTAPQTWRWTREIGPGKALAALALLALSLAVLATQKFNPFLYFVF